MKRYERRAASPCRANSAQERAQRRIKPRDYPHDRGGTKAPQTRRKRPGRAALVEPRTTAKKRTRNAQRREAEFKKIYIHHAKQAQFEAPAKVRRNPTPDGNGRRTWKRGEESDSEPPPQVRAILSASASARFGADSGAAGGRPGNGRGAQMRFRMFSKRRLAQSKDARKPRARKRTLWLGGLVYM